MPVTELYLRLGIALGLGLIVGLQRERVFKGSAGIRTYALIALTGAVSGILADRYGEWIIAAGFFSLALLHATSSFLSHQKDPEAGIGLTTEVATLLMYGVAAYVMIGEKSVAVVLGGVIALLLHFKAPMHSFVRGLEEDDVRAIMLFVLISLVILPVLPNQTYGPYDVLNPFNIWLMVVLIVGIGLAAYIGYKFLGTRAGTVLGGILGGLISSTATTVSAARATKGSPGQAAPATLVIMIASAISVVRVIIEIGAVARSHLLEASRPLGLFLLIAIALCALTYWRSRKRLMEAPEPQNPAELKPAIIFGILYALVLLAVAFAKEHLGQGGLYAVGIISGLTDMDAITLSTGQMMQSGSIDPGTGWRIILTATMANLLFKAGAVALLGDRKLLTRIALLYLILILSGIAIILLWPR